MRKTIPKHWSFSLNGEEVSFIDLSWREVLKETVDRERGEVAASSEVASVQFEFNATHAAVLYMKRGGEIVRPYFPGRSATAQDITPFYCKHGGELLGPQDEYLARFMERGEGFRLFEAVLRGRELPRVWEGETLEWRAVPGQEKSESR